MNNLQRFLLLAGSVLICTIASQAGNSRPALWIEVKNDDEGLTRIAVTKEIAAALLEEDNEAAAHLTRCGDSGLITKQMISDVLDGTKDIVRVRDPKNGSEVTLYVKDITLPRHAGSTGSVVLETYRDGERTFRMKLGEFEIEGCDKDDIGASFGWKHILPFLSKTGGALYVNSEQEDTEVWLFMD